MNQLSIVLASYQATGAVHSEWGAVSLTGDSTSLNVFSLSATTLAGATSLSLDIPQGSGALINVSGTVVNMRNMGFDLRGATPAQLLWNMAEATDVSLFSIGFPGSLMAPRADVVFNNGNLAGTLVAHSLHGTGELHHAPLDVELVLGEGTGGPIQASNYVTLRPVRRLAAECTYTFEVMGNQALSSSGNCLDDFLIVGFTTRPEGKGVIDDLTQLRRSGRSPGLTAFAPREGVYVSAEEAVVRYKGELGIPDEDTLTFDDTPPRVHPKLANVEVVRTRQYHDGILVDSPGFFIHRDMTGALVYAHGRGVDLHEPTTNAVVGRQAAKDSAASKLLYAGGPSATLGEPGSLTLRYVNGRGTQRGEDYELVWHVPVLLEGRPISWIDVSAIDGSVVRAAAFASDFHDSRYVSHMQAMSYQGTTQLSYPTVFGSTDTVRAVRLLDENGVEVVTLASGDPTLNPQPADLVAAYLIDSTLDLSDPAGYNSPSVDADHNGILMIQDPNLPFESRSASLASLYATVQPARDYLVSSNLRANGSPWIGIQGKGLDQVSVEYDFYNPGGTPFHVQAVHRSLLNDRIVLRMVQSINNDHEPIFASAGYHEIGHLVFGSLRQQAGMDFMVGEHEAGALSEALADIFASSVALHHGQLEPSWSLIRGWLSRADLDRDLADPGATGNPDFYEESDEGDDYSIHEHSTIVSHWAHLLTEGDASAGRCNIRVDPLVPASGSQQASRDKLMQLLFDTVPELDKSDGFLALRDYTYDIALLESDEMARSVAAAWLAVGLGSAARPFPQDGDTGLDPWDLTVEFEAVLPGTYTVQVAEDEAFTVGVMSRLAVAELDEDQLEVQMPLLKPDTTYHWRVAPGSAPEDANDWSDCALGSWKFKTAPKQVELEAMTELSENAYRTNFLGHVKLTGPEIFELRFQSGVPPNCTEPAEPNKVIYADGPVSHFHLGSAFDNEPLVDTGSGLQLPPYQQTGPFPEEYYRTISDSGERIFVRHIFTGLQPGTPIFLAVTPGAGDWAGECQVFELRMTDLGSFGMERKNDNQFQPDLVRLDHLTGAPLDGLTFSQSSGAAQYAVRFSKVNAEQDQFSIIAEQTRDTGCGMESNGPFLDWQLNGCSSDNFLSAFGAGPRSDDAPYYTWQAFAIDGFGQRREARSNGIQTSDGATPFGFQWDGVPWDPRRPVEPQFRFAEERGVRLADILDGPPPTGAHDDFWASQGVSPVENWSEVEFSYPGTWDDIENLADKYIRVCVPRQVPFVDAIEVRAVSLTGGEVAQSGPHYFQFDTSQSAKGDPTCEQVRVFYQNVRTSFVMRSLSSLGTMSPWRGIMQERIVPEEDDPPDEEPECPPEPLPAPRSNAGTPTCQETSTTRGTLTASDGTVLDIRAVQCPEVLPQLQEFKLGWDSVPGAVRYVAGICGGNGCRLWEEPSANVVRPLGVAELGPLSDEEGRFTVAAWAVDACGNWGDSFSTAFTYVGPGGAGSVCDFCCLDPSDECVGTCSEGICAKECRESASCK